MKTVIIDENIKLKPLFQLFTINQRKKIYDENLFPLWESQSWFAFKQKTNSTDIKKFKNYLKDYYDNKQILKFVTINKEYLIYFITMEFDKFLSSYINNNYEYKIRNINKLVNSKNKTNLNEKYKNYIEKYRIESVNLPNWNLTDKEIEEFCEVCDNYPELVNQYHFILHNVLQWI